MGFEAFFLFVVLPMGYISLVFQVLKLRADIKSQREWIAILSHRQWREMHEDLP